MSLYAVRVKEFGATLGGVVTRWQGGGRDGDQLDQPGIIGDTIQLADSRLTSPHDLNRKLF